MAFDTVQQLLEVIREAHRKVGRFYEYLSQDTERGRVEMLLAYLARHEKQLSEGLQSFMDTADEATLDTWFNYAPDFSMEEKIAEVEFNEQSSLNEVVEMALSLDDYIIQLYQALAANAPSPEVRDVFQNLIEQEKKEENQVVRMASDLERFI